MKKPAVTRGRRSRKKLNKKEIVDVLALKAMGNSNYAVSKRTGIDNHTVAKYLKDQDAYNQPDIQADIDRVMEGEINDLAVLTVKARQRLHDLAPKANMIESIALMDRTFQQRRLIQGKSTQNIATLARIIKEANKDLED